MMKLVQVVILVFFLVSVCLLQSAVGDAPGDEHGLCRQDDNDTEIVLLDSYNYINLLDGVSSLHQCGRHNHTSLEMMG